MRDAEGAAPRFIFIFSILNPIMREGIDSAGEGFLVEDVGFEESLRR